ALGPLGGRSEVADGQRRGVGGEDRLVLHDVVETHEEVPLDRELLHDRLDQQVDVREVVEMGRPAEPLEERAMVGRAQLAALDVLLELLLHAPALRVEAAWRRLGEDGLEAGAGRRLRDAESHLSGTEDADFADLHRAEQLRHFERRRQRRGLATAPGPDVRYWRAAWRRRRDVRPLAGRSVARGTA